jgi:hypothetical protein
MSLERPEPDTTVVFVRFEHRDDSLGIGTPEPRLSWQVRTEVPAWRQTAYEVEPAGATTVRVGSAEQVLVPWCFAPLASRGHEPGLWGPAADALTRRGLGVGHRTTGPVAGAVPGRTGT